MDVCYQLSPVNLPSQRCSLPSPSIELKLFWRWLDPVTYPTIRRGHAGNIEFFFTPAAAAADGLSVEFEGQSVPSSLQDSSRYSGRF